MTETPYTYEYYMWAGTPVRVLHAPGNKVAGAQKFDAEAKNWIFTSVMASDHSDELEPSTAEEVAEVCATLTAKKPERPPAAHSISTSIGALEP